MLETIVFLGCHKSGSSRDALKAAKEMGYEVVLVTERKKIIHQWPDFPEVDQMFYRKNMENSREILTQLLMKGKQIAAVLSLIDPFVPLAAQLQSEIGLFTLSTNALALLQDKSHFREALIHTSSSPYFQLYKGYDALPFSENRSFIVKPPVSNGSKGVVLVRNQEQFEKVLKSSSLPILIEEYLEGPQFLIEVVVFQGGIQIVAIIEQEISNGKRFIVTGYQYPANLTLEEREALYDEVSTIIRTIQLENGSCHFEMRLVRGEWKLIEINPRMSGGAMNRIIQAATGVNLAKEVIRLNMGKEPNFYQTEDRAVFAKFLTIDSRGRFIKVTGRNRASRQKGVLEVYVKPKRGAVLTEPVSLGSRYAYVIATGETTEEAKNNAIHAAKEIRFVMEKI